MPCCSSPYPGQKTSPAWQRGLRPRTIVTGSIAPDAPYRHVGLDRLAGSPLGQTIQAEQPPRSEWLVPTMIQSELARCLTPEVGADDANQAIAFTTTCVVMISTPPSRCRRRSLDAAQTGYRGRHHLRNRPSPRCRRADLRPAFSGSFWGAIHRQTDGVRPQQPAAL